MKRSLVIACLVAAGAAAAGAVALADAESGQPSLLADAGQLETTSPEAGTPGNPSGEPESPRPGEDDDDDKNGMTCC